MTIADIYNFIYMIIAVVFTTYYLSFYGKTNLSDNMASLHRTHSFLILIVGLIVFLGTRPVYGNFYDTIVYNRYLTQLYDINYEFTFDTPNIIWDNFIGYWGKYQLSPTLFFVTVEFIYLFFAYKAIIKFFPEDYIIAYLVYLAAFSTFSYGTNGIKAGAAASLFLVGLAYHDKWKVWVPMLLASWGMHHSMQIPVIVFIIILYFRNPKIYFVFWFVCLALSVAGITAFSHEIAVDYVDEKSAGYLLAGENEEWVGKSGFRLDFVLYSAMPILVGWNALYKQRIKDATYNLLLCLYLALNGAWTLCMYISYNNRIAYLSWLMYPVVLIYPLLNCEWSGNRYTLFKKIVWGHFVFTFVMVALKAISRGVS